MRGGKAAPVKMDANETEHPRVENDHRAGKLRYPSPRKGRPKSNRNTEELLKNVKISDKTEDDEETARMLDVLHTATDLVESKVTKDKDFKRSIETFPHLQVGDMLKKKDVGFGFRVNESSNVSMMTNGDVKITEGDSASTSSEKIVAVIMKYQRGFAWCYWTNDKIGSQGKTLSECLRDYGTGVKQTEEGIYIKGVFLTEELSTSTGKFFTLAVMKKDEQFHSVQQEKNDSVFRVFRSCVPTYINDIINLHHLVNIRNQNKGRLFWDM